MRTKAFVIAFFGIVLLIAQPLSAAAPAPDPNISVVGYFSQDKAQRGRPVRVSIVIDIPRGYHINSNRPLESYLIATSVKPEPENGLRAGVVSYPRPLMKTFKFSQKQLSVYEGQVRLKFNVTLPANYADDSVKVKARVRLQSCNDEVCFPPKNYDISLKIEVAGTNERVRQTNGWAFK
jgi:DsbC/DsbD-like thiol-disulfide interchange protein